MRIIDCFSYFNEKELLELRINLLRDKVDKFIITDANKTHKGTPKPFTCKKTLQELGLMCDKIQVIELDLPSYDEEPSAWVRERMQRNAAEKFIEDNDICIVSDCDEIINPDLIDYFVNVSQQHSQNILRIPLAFLMSRGDLRVYNQNGNIVPWNVPFICMKHHLKKYTLSDIRESHSLGTHHLDFPDIFITENGKIEDAGWHFSWMGDFDRLKFKCDSFLHWDEVSIEENYIPQENSTDPLGRKDHILKKYSFLNLPQKIFYLDNVYKFILPHFKINPFSTETELGEKWFSYPNLYNKVVKHFPSGSKFVEVGSWKGMSSLYMATEIINSGKNIDFCCVDTWQGSLEHDGFENMETLYDIFLTNMKPVENYYSHIKNTSLESSKLFEDDSLDFVFIDASHEYEDVKNDILAWLPKVKDGGILAGHDYYVNTDWFPGVKKAVNEIFDCFETDEDCFIVKVNKKEVKSLLSILKKNPFLITDKNTVCYKQYPEQWPWMQYHSYIENFYEKSFEKYQNKDDIKLCEIGIDVGGSIALWSEYFKSGSITGIDIKTDRLNDQYKSENFHNVEYLIDNAYDENFIDSLSSFDIIIDDGPHTFSTMLIFIEKYIHKLNPGGLMVIEDIPSIEWIDYFKLLVPTNLKTEVIDLRQIDQRYDSLIFTIQK